MRSSENFDASASLCSRTSCAVLFRQRLRHDGNLLAALEVLERRRLVVVELDLRRVEHVEDDHVVAAEAQRRDRVDAPPAGSS